MIATLHPCIPNANAQAYPIPVAPPVTITTFPFNTSFLNGDLLVGDNTENQINFYNKGFYIKKKK